MMNNNERMCCAFYLEWNICCFLIIFGSVLSSFYKQKSMCIYIGFESIHTCSVTKWILLQYIFLFYCFIQFVRMLLKLCAYVLYMNIVYVRLYGFSMNVNLNKSYLGYIFALIT
jgi:hypothetical protein